jgi:hypothetical protein
MIKYIGRMMFTRLLESRARTLITFRIVNRSTDHLHHYHYGEVHHCILYVPAVLGRSWVDVTEHIRMRITPFFQVLEEALND